jgi:hypothetical protein
LLAPPLLAPPFLTLTLTLSLSLTTGRLTTGP